MPQPKLSPEQKEEKALASARARLEEQYALYLDAEARVDAAMLRGPEIPVVARALAYRQAKKDNQSLFGVVYLAHSWAWTDNHSNHACWRRKTTAAAKQNGDVAATSGEVSRFVRLIAREKENTLAQATTMEGQIAVLSAVSWEQEAKLVDLYEQEREAYAAYLAKQNALRDVQREIGLYHGC